VSAKQRRGDVDTAHTGTVATAAADDDDQFNVGYCCCQPSIVEA